jgi:nucleoside phosphorylase
VIDRSKSSFIMNNSDLSSRLHDLLASHPITGRLYSIPLLIFFAKQEELDKALPVFRSSDLCTIERDPIIDDAKLEFLPGNIHVDCAINGARQPGIVEFYTVCGQEQGPENAAAVVSYILTKYQPRFAISIGICAGVHQIRLSDVLFATSAVNYEAGKMNSDGGFELDLHLSYANKDVKGEVKKLIGEDESKIYHEGCMLTGSAVRKDADLLFSKYRERMPRDVKGLDMEANAFFTACKVCGVVAMPVIKGISDMGDAAKNDETHRICVERATKAGLRLLKNYFSKSQMQQHWKNQKKT